MLDMLNLEYAKKDLNVVALILHSTLASIP